MASSATPRLMSENHNSRPSRQVSSPWTQIVRGESDLIATAAAVPSSSQSKAPIEDPIVSVSVASSLLTVEDEKSEESGGQGDAGKKPVWKTPSNGASEVGPVMGASSWPALSETTKAPSNKPSSDSLKSLGDVASSSSSSVPVSQEIANASVATPKQVSRANPNSTPNNSRQRSFKRNGPSGYANGTVSQPLAQGSFAELPLHNPSPRGQNQIASQTHGGTNNLSQRESYRYQNGNHHQNHGGRRNQEHGNQNWNSHRSFNGREGNPQSQRGAPAFLRHAPPPPPPPPVQPIPPQFLAAQPIQPFGGPLPFPPELASPYYPHIPYMTPLAPPPVFYHVQDLPLNVKLQTQIQFYFSDDNLCTDTYLRSFMDDQGFVPLRVIAGFNKVAELTDSIQQIVEALQGSPYVEVQDDKIRKRHNWQTWLLPKIMTTGAVSSSQSAEKADSVTKRFGNLSLNQSSVASSNQAQPTETENNLQTQSSGADQVSNHNDSDGSNR